MTKRISAKHKIERRYGLLWGQEGSPAHVRSYPPGQHGPKGARKLTDYGHQMAAKQKLKGYYGNIGERQFRNIYHEAVRLRGDTGENLLQLLESRLDAAIYRLKWAPTVFSARQIVNHRHVRVNGHRVNIPSYRLKPGDMITLDEGMQNNPLVTSAVASQERDVPEYFEVTSFKAKFVNKPDPAKIPYPTQMNVSSVIECYSR